MGRVKSSDVGSAKKPGTCRYHQAGFFVRSARYTASASCHGRGGVTPAEASFALKSTLYAGRRAAAPNSAEVIAVRLGFSPARRKISAANSCQVQEPALVTWKRPV